jgi:hypothetical protein
MLQLLLEGGQGYDDIGSLLGIGPDEVRSRARAALREIGGTDPDAQVGLSDYLLGQADPIGRADAVRHLQADPEANALAQRLVQNLRLLAPKAQLPEIPEPRGGRPAPAPSPPPTPAQAPAASGPAAPAPSTAQARGPGFAASAAGFFSGLGRLKGRRRTQLIAGLAAALALVIVLIVVATSGGDNGGSDCKPLDVSAARQSGIPTVQLSPVGAAAETACPPTGQITLVPLSNQQGQRNQQQVAGFAVQTNAAHLQPTADGEVYVLWLYGSDDKARPLGQETVNDDGNLNGAAPLATQQLLYLQALPSIRVSRVSQSQAQQINQALQAQSGKKATGLVPFAGTAVLEGSSTDLLQQLQTQLQQAQSQAGAGQRAASGKKG